MYSYNATNQLHNSLSLFFNSTKYTHTLTHTTIHSLSTKPILSLPFVVAYDYRSSSTNQPTMSSTPSSSSSKLCFNSDCKDFKSDRPKKGWRLRTGDLAQLCDRCGLALFSQLTLTFFIFYLFIQNTK
jgi:hypothetical protein